MDEHSVARINRIDIENFRCIQELHIDLRPFTVLIGANGAGKSTFLEALRLLGRLPGNEFDASFTEFGGFEATRSWYADDPEISFQIAVSKGTTSVHYWIRFRSEQGGYFVKLEDLVRFNAGERQTLLRRDDAAVTHIRMHDQEEQHSSAGHNRKLVMPVLLKEVGCAELLERMQPSTFSWKSHRFQPDRVVRSPQQLSPTTVPNNAGEDLFSALYSMRTNRREDYDDLLDALRSAIPELEELEFPVAGSGYVHLTWKLRGVENPVYTNQLSDGTLRLLWLLTALYSAPDEGLILIDEPETGFHPQWLMLLASHMRSRSARTTIVVATQSPEFIRWIEKDELLIVDIGEDKHGAQFSWANEHPNIDKWLEDFTLSELWTMGELGGRR